MLSATPGPYVIKPGLAGPPAIESVLAGDGSLNVAWTAPSYTGGSDILAYDLRYIRSEAQDRADANWRLLYNLWLYTGPLNLPLTGLENGVRYDVQMRATNAAGSGPWSITASGTPTDAPQSQTPPGAPSIEAVTPSDRSLAITWATPAATGGSIVTAYDVHHIRSDAADKSDPHWSLRDRRLDLGRPGIHCQRTGQRGPSTTSRCGR